MIDFADPKWRFEERVTNMMNKGNTREQAEHVVKTVIETKEGPHDIHFQPSNQSQDPTNTE